MRSEPAPFLASVVRLRPREAAPSPAPLSDPEIPAGAGPAAELPEPAPAGMDLAAAAEWRLARRVLFRFVLVYLVLYNLPFPLGTLPFTATLAQWYGNLWNEVVPFVGWLVFRADITVLPNGSGDTTFNYVQLFVYLVLAAIATYVWSRLDSRRRHYTRLQAGLTIYLRYVLAVTLISYGAYKVIKSQFPAPSLDRLLQPIGDASPMGLLWTFMGASTAYTIFSGAAEMAGGLLLTARRTTTVGALVSFGVMLNVVVLNFCYDVPVKLYSFHLLAMTAFLIALDWRRLANVLLLNRATAPVEIRPLFRNPRLERVSLVVRTLVVAGITAQTLYVSYQASTTYGDLAPKSPLYGIWNVEEMVVDGQVRPPLTTDETRWRRVVFDYPTMLAIQDMSDSRKRFGLQLDAGKRVLALSKWDDRSWRSSLSYRKPAPGLLTLEGTFDGKKVRAVLRRVDESKFQLIDRGFHWINEYPYNR